MNLNSMIITKIGKKNNDLNPSSIGIENPNLNYIFIKCNECDCEFLFPESNAISYPTVILCPNDSCNKKKGIYILEDRSYSNDRPREKCIIN